MLLFTAPPTVRIVHSGQACNVEEERYSERVYTIKEGETLELQCLVTGHPRPQVTTCWVYWERFDFVWKKTGHEMAKSEQSLRSHVSTRCTHVDSSEQSVNRPLSSAACWSARAPTEWSYCGAFESQNRQQSHSDEEEEKKPREEEENHCCLWMKTDS